MHLLGFNHKPEDSMASAALSIHGSLTNMAITVSTTQNLHDINEREILAHDVLRIGNVGMVVVVVAVMVVAIVVVVVVVAAVVVVAVVVVVGGGGGGKRRSSR